MDIGAEAIVRRQAGGRDIYLCDGLVPEPMVGRIAGLLKATLKFHRVERSRADTVIGAASADIPEQLARSEHLFDRMRTFACHAFGNARLGKLRLYVNCAVYGDVYYPHRDCDADKENITVLYYANPQWNADWGGETLFYGDNGEAEVAVSPRPGRMVAFPGALLHCGGVPTRICYEERLTVAYKLAPLPPS